MDIDFSSGKAILTSDNEEAVNRTNNELTTTNVSETHTPDYDLWKLIWELKGKLPVRIEAKWVKSHQDKCKQGKKIFGPFPREVELNIEMDAEASKARSNRSLLKFKHCTTLHTKMGLYDKQGKMIFDFWRHIYNKVNGKLLSQYILRKYNWNSLEQDIVDWSSIEKTMKTYTEHKKTKVIQLL